MYVLYFTLPVYAEETNTSLNLECTCISQLKCLQGFPSLVTVLLWLKFIFDYYFPPFLIVFWTMAWCRINFWWPSLLWVIQCTVCVKMFCITRIPWVPWLWKSIKNTSLILWPKLYSICINSCPFLFRVLVVQNFITTPKTLRFITEYWLIFAAD